MQLLKKTNRGNQQIADFIFPQNPSIKAKWLEEKKNNNILMLYLWVTYISKWYIKYLFTGIQITQTNKWNYRKWYFTHNFMINNVLHKITSYSDCVSHCTVAYFLK